MSPLGATKPPSCVHPSCIPSPLYKIQILVATPPTFLWLPVVYLYRPLLNFFLLLPVPLPPRASSMSRLLSAALGSLWSVWENLCVLFLPSSPLPPKGLKFTNHKVISLVPPPCKTLQTPWGPPLLVEAVSPASPRPTLRALFLPYHRSIITYLIYGSSQLLKHFHTLHHLVSLFPFQTGLHIATPSCHLCNNFLLFLAFSFLKNIPIMLVLVSLAFFDLSDPIYSSGTK